MITHVIVKLDVPIEEKYWQDDDIFNNEYYGLGKPLIWCKDCKHYADECCDRYADETLGYVHSTQEYGYCWVAERKEE